MDHDERRKPSQGMQDELCVRTLAQTTHQAGRDALDNLRFSSKGAPETKVSTHHFSTPHPISLSRNASSAAYRGNPNVLSCLAK